MSLLLSSSSSLPSFIDIHYQGINLIKATQPFQNGSNAVQTKWLQCNWKLLIWIVWTLQFDQNYHFTESEKAFANAKYILYLFYWKAIEFILILLHISRVVDRAKKKWQTAFFNGKGQVFQITSQNDLHSIRIAIHSLKYWLRKQYRSNLYNAYSVGRAVSIAFCMQIFKASAKIFRYLAPFFSMPRKKKHRTKFNIPKNLIKT